MKTYVVTFVVQAENVEDATQQASGYLDGAFGRLMPSQRPDFAVAAIDGYPTPAPRLATRLCAICSKQILKTDDWVQVCGEECEARYLTRERAPTPDDE